MLAVGIFNSQFYRNCHAVSTATTHTCRCSSVEERLNPDLRHLRPAMVRQRVGYPLITGRTLDRNQPPAITKLFLQGAAPPVSPPSLRHLGLHEGLRHTGITPVFFVTHFSICHSFLDFLYMPILAPNGGDGFSGEIEAPRSRDCPVTQGTPSPVNPLAYGTKG